MQTAVVQAKNHIERHCLRLTIDAVLTAIKEGTKVSGYDITTVMSILYPLMHSYNLKAQDTIDIPSLSGLLEQMTFSLEEHVEFARNLLSEIRSDNPTIDIDRYVDQYTLYYSRVVTTADMRGIDPLKYCAEQGLEPPEALQLSLRFNN